MIMVIEVKMLYNRILGLSINLGLFSHVSTNIVNRIKRLGNSMPT